MSQSRRVGGAIRPENGDLGTDAVIAAFAGRQHGVVGRAQLLAAGIETTAIKRRVQASRLHPLYRGVYAVGHRVLTQRGRWMAATLATNGVLSHRSAGALWGVHGMSVDQEGNLYVAEVDSGRVQKFSPKKGANPDYLVSKPVARVWK